MSILRSTASALAVAGVLALTGCSGSVSVGGGDPALDQAEVEQQVKAKLGESVGREPEEVACPGDLVGEVGETMRCTLTDSGTTVGVIISVTGVEGTDVRFDIDADQELQQ